MLSENTVRKGYNVLNPVVIKQKDLKLPPQRHLPVNNWYNKQRTRNFERMPPQARTIPGLDEMEQSMLERMGKRLVVGLDDFLARAASEYIQVPKRDENGRIVRDPVTSKPILMPITLQDAVNNPMYLPSVINYYAAKLSSEKSEMGAVSPYDAKAAQVAVKASDEAGIPVETKTRLLINDILTMFGIAGDDGKEEPEPIPAEEIPSISDVMRRVEKMDKVIAGKWAIIFRSENITPDKVIRWMGEGVLNDNLSAIAAKTGDESLIRTADDLGVVLAEGYKQYLRQIARETESRVGEEPEDVIPERKEAEPEPEPEPERKEAEPEPEEEELTFNDVFDEIHIPLGNRDTLDNQWMDEVRAFAEEQNVAFTREKFQDMFDDIAAKAAGKWNISANTWFTSKGARKILEGSTIYSRLKQSGKEGAKKGMVIRIIAVNNVKLARIQKGEGKKKRKTKKRLRTAGTVLASLGGVSAVGMADPTRGKLETGVPAVVLGGLGGILHGIASGL